MIERYQRPIMKHLWSDAHKYQSFILVELANNYGWMKQGLYDLTTFEKLSEVTVDIKRIETIEKDTRHDVVAFVKACSESLGEERKWFHYGLTSTDIVDTAYALILKDVNKVLLEGIDQFMSVLKDQALRYQKTPIMGRTHGMHAEVTSFGLKFALWYEDFKRLRAKFLIAADEMEVIKLSGAVGHFSTSHPDIQKEAARYLGLKESVLTTQTLQRDRHAFYVSVLALFGAELEKIATEIRHLSRSEVQEVSEPFHTEQKGSSAMPHKRNPIASENLCGLSRMLRGYLIPTFENIALWHERDISHSSVERIVLQDSTSLLDYMLARYKETLSHLVVNEGNMIANIERSQGRYVTQHLLNTLVDFGFDRLTMHDHVQRLSALSEKEGKHFKDIIQADPLIQSVLDEKTILNLFLFDRFFTHVPYLIQKVFE